jgi:S1-C subfamily serine protease
VNIVDVIVLVLLVFAAARGWHRGLLGQMFELGGGFLGLLSGIALGPRIAGAFTQTAGIEGALISLAVVIVLVSIGQTAGFMVGHGFGSYARRARLGTLNQGLGSGFGILIIFVTFWLVGSLLVQIPSRPVARAVQHSTLLRRVNRVLPAPPNLLAYFGQYLRTSGFPQVFAGLPPAIGPAVDLPSNRAARQAVRAAAESTVRVVVPACGSTQLGSGWVAADGTVVTNAHVVAGGDEVTVQDGDGDHAGTVVLYDPATDVAILSVDGLAGPPLDLEVAPQDRGAGGATLGYPGGGDLTFHPAAVQGRYPAVGLDIYARSQVRREVYELRSPVREGDSGGPFVLPNGDVAGVVFAASTTDGGTGYALTAAEVAEEIRAGIGRTEPASTGGCTR